MPEIAVGRRWPTRRQRADELMAEGDMDGRRVWHRIGDAIDEPRAEGAGPG